MKYRATHIAFIRRFTRSSVIFRVTVAMLVAIFAVNEIIASYATVPAAATEAERGILSGGTSLQVSNSASGGKYVQFGASEAGTSSPSGDCSAPTVVTNAILNCRNLIYGSEIGAWDMDGGVALHNATAQQNIRSAKIRIIRLGLWQQFGSQLSDAQFKANVQGIQQLGAIPLIQLPPLVNTSTDNQCSEWSLAWMEEIVRDAGSGVLYEFANEPDNYCGWSASTYTTNWENTIPQLKAYARSLGYTIYVGGPAWANSYPEDEAAFQTFLSGVKSMYQSTGNFDYIPAFISSHTYLTTSEDATCTSMQPRIAQWQQFYTDLGSMIKTTFGGMNDPQGKPISSDIRVADTEWNFTIDTSSNLANSQSYATCYINQMFQMMRSANVWLSDQFTLQSNDGALDMLNTDGTARPLFTAYKAISTSDPLNK